MSEKRLASSGDSFVDLTEMQIVDLLNKLSDENTRLHKKVDEQQATITALKEENEQLKEDVNDYHNALFDLHKKYDKLEKENEQLRKELNDCEKFRYQVFKRMGELSDE